MFVLLYLQTYVRVEVRLSILKIFEKIIFIIFAIIVSLTTIAAFYLNRPKFEKTAIARYTQIKVEEPAEIEQIAQNYSDPVLKDRFIKETEKINSLKSTNYISNQVIIIPVFD